MKIKDWLYKFYLPARQVVRMRKNQNISWNNKKITVLFFIQYTPSWGKMRLLYQSLLKDDRFKVYLFCMPESWDSGNETYQYFKERGYDAINARQEDGSWFDLKTLKPDYIMTTRPYDYTEPIEYYSQNLCKIAKICNFSYGINIDENIAKWVYTQPFYRHTYMYFVEMEFLEEVYKKYQKLGTKLNLCHVKHLGMIALDDFMSQRNDESISWKFAKGNMRIMWTPRWNTDKTLGGSNFFTFKDFWIDYCKEHREVDLLIRPHPLMFSHFEQTGELTKEAALDYKKLISESENIALDEEKEYAANFWNTDVLVTDYSSIVPEFFLTEKPLIFCKKNMELPLLDNMKDILKASYVVETAEELYDCLEELRQGKDTKKDIRIEMKQKLFGKTLGKSVELTTNWLIEDWRKSNAGN